MQESVIPQKYKVLSGSVLKTIALVSMIIDHVAFVFSYKFTKPLFTVGIKSYSAYTIMRWIGRIAFPIYCFLLVEGFLHTRDRKKYALRLFAFAVISEIPWNLIHTMKLSYSGQNVFFTLFLGCLGMICVEYFKNDRPKMLFSLMALLAVSLLLKADYGITGFCFIMMMYALRDQKILQAVVGCGILSSTWIAGLAFIPINLYNGERGFINCRALQYCYYAIYPVHFLIFYLIKRSM